MNAALLLCGLVMACMAMHGEAGSSCSGKWAKMPNSTMCRYSRPSHSAKNCGVSEKDKKMILDTHNRLRAGVSPTASNMLKMYWNDDLAVVAQQWATQCRSAHDTNENRQIPDTGEYMTIGQNWASGQIFPDWRAAIEDGWHSEVKNFRFGGFYHNGPVEQYTQVVQGPANLVGCGHCDCPQGPLYICNYYRGNSRKIRYPYAYGPKACKTGICDCGNIMCKNNGTMNPQTCKCDCFDRHVGKDCSEYKCPPRDEEGCGGFYPKDGCEKYDIVYRACPYMCGLCKPGDHKTGGGGGNADCKDSNEWCRSRARKGECKKNPIWMRANCKKACYLC